MGQFFKYILYALFAIFCSMWVIQVFKACSNPEDKTSLETTSGTDTLTDTDGKETLDDAQGNDDDDDLIVYNEEDEGFDEDDDEDDFLDDEETDDSLEEEEADEYDRTQALATATAEKENGSDKFTSRGSMSDDHYMVIAGSFQNQANAETYITQLDELGYEDAEIVRFDKSSFYAVCTGRFENKADANSMVTSLKKHKLPAYVHKKRSGKH